VSPHEGNVTWYWIERAGGTRSGGSGPSW
jgi:hypothetical protein